jgi:branched-chain amino acid transport system ATP-binding protein
VAGRRNKLKGILQAEEWSGMAAILEVSNLSRYFGGLAAVKDVSFDVEPGEIFGLIGPNGAGKTTLFSMIAGSLKPSAGRISFLGKNVTGQRSFQAVRRGIARTHQVVRPFKSMSVLENMRVAIHFGRRRITSSSAATTAALEALSYVGLEDQAHKPALVLPIGSQKRLELARALATDPALLLCDEICGGLTNAETAAILDLLRTIRERGATIVYIEHDVRAVMSVCHRILVLNYGRRLAEGKPEEIQNNEAVIEAYLGTRTVGKDHE